MPDFVILTDSTCDLPDEMIAELDIQALPLSVNIGETTYKEFPIEEFYQKLREGMLASTNAINIGEYIDAMEPILQSGQDILLLAFSSGLSTTYNSAAMAAKEISDKYPQRKIYVVDTLAASLGEGLLIWHAVNLKREGKSIEEVRDWVENNKLHLCHWFTVNDLHHLKRGGRVSAATAVVGTMLGIKPVLHMDNAGQLIFVEKARGRQTALLKLLSHMEETAINPSEQTVFICHSDCYDEAKWLGDKIQERFGVKHIEIGYIGPVIGSHTGVGTISIFFLGTER